MITQQAQIKLNLPVSLKDYLESKAQKFGVPLAGYIRHLILQDVADMEYPAYQASKKTEDAYKLALKEKEEGKLMTIKDLDKFFEEL